MALRRSCLVLALAGLACGCQTIKPLAPRTVVPLKKAGGLMLAASQSAFYNTPTGTWKLTSLKLGGDAMDVVLTKASNGDTKDRHWAYSECVVLWADSFTIVPEHYALACGTNSDIGQRTLCLVWPKEMKRDAMAFARGLLALQDAEPEQITAAYPDALVAAGDDEGPGDAAETPAPKKAPARKTSAVQDQDEP